MKKNLVFRLDFSGKFGYGHLVRCLTLLEKINSQNYIISFIILSNDFKNPFLKIIKNYQIYKLNLSSKNYRININKDIKFTSEILKKINNPILIIDSYSINYNWCIKMNKFSKKLILFNDFIKNKLFCDVLIDQTYGRKKKDYKDIVTHNTKLYTGHRYALIRKQFNFSINYSYNNNILISLGGTDPKQKTLKIIKLIFNSFEKFKIFILIDENSLQYKKIIQKYNNHIKLKKINILKQKYNISKIYKKFNLCIGSGGVSAIERCKIGLPSFVFKAAKNQADIVNNLRRNNLIKTWENNKELLELLKKYNKNKSNLKLLNRNCLNSKIATNTDKMIRSILK